MELEKIASFQVDHTRLERGLYLSRIDGDIKTWDLRMKKPNVDPVLANGAIHTIEHLAATYLRSSPLSAGIVYFGPMGCRTGCYLLTKGLSDAEVGGALRAAFTFIRAFDGPVPGATPVECGNYKEHDLEGARAEAGAYLQVLEAWTPDRRLYA